MTTRQDFIDAVKTLVPGENPGGEGSILLAIAQAVKEHSKRKPRKIVEDVDGADDFDYALSDLASWADGFSVISAVEYPVDDTDETADVLQENQWRIYEKPAGKQLRFLEHRPDTGETIRVTYSALHTVSDAASTIETFDEEAFQALAAAYHCETLATYYAQEGDSTVQADSVNHQSRSRDYAARAKAFRAMYYNHLGVNPNKAVAASVTRDQDRSGSWGSDHLTHPRRYR